MCLINFKDFDLFFGRLVFWELENDVLLVFFFNFNFGIRVWWDGELVNKVSEFRCLLLWIGIIVEVVWYCCLCFFLLLIFVCRFCVVLVDVFCLLCWYWLVYLLCCFRWIIIFWLILRLLGILWFGFCLGYIFMGNLRLLEGR